MHSNKDGHESFAAFQGLSGVGFDDGGGGQECLLW